MAGFSIRSAFLAASAALALLLLDRPAIAQGRSVRGGPMAVRAVPMQAGAMPVRTATPGTANSFAGQRASAFQPIQVAPSNLFMGPNSIFNPNSPLRFQYMFSS